MERLNIFSSIWYIIRNSNEIDMVKVVSGLLYEPGEERWESILSQLTSQERFSACIACHVLSSTFLGVGVFSP